MEIKLLDYSGDPTMVDVGDVDHVVIDVLSGDMVMTYPFFQDSSGTRTMTFFDGSVIVQKKDFDKLNAIENSYDLFGIEDGEF